MKICKHIPIADATQSFTRVLVQLVMMFIMPCNVCEETWDLYI